MTTDTSARAEAERHAGEVKETVKEQGSRVTGTAAGQTREVAQDALDRAKDLGGELKTTVSRETGQQRDRVVGAIREFASELDSMSSGSEQSGFAAQATSTVAQQIRSFADTLDGSTGQDLGQALRSFAQRKPVTFLAGAALAGVVVGRFVRGVQAGEPNSGPSAGSGYRTGEVGSTGYASPAYNTPAYDTPAYDTPATTGYVPPASTGVIVTDVEEEYPVRSTPRVIGEDPLDGDRELGEVRLLESEPAYRPEGRP